MNKMQKFTCLAILQKIIEHLVKFMRRQIKLVRTFCSV